MSGSRKERKAATRIALLQAALRCFSSQGYGEASIGSITKEAGVAHGTFYVHFPSKEAALDELLVDFNGEFTRRLMPMFADIANLSTEDLIRQSAGTVLDYWLERRDFIEIYVERASAGLSLSALRDGLSPPMVQTVSSWVRLLAAQVNQTVGNPELVAQALLAMWFRVGLQFLFNPLVSREEAIELLVQMTGGAIEGLFSSADSHLSQEETHAQRRSP
jgi:AcrR family transcriptional regulator